ncbi:MAG: hypothetical protein IJU52_01005, partial [Clostridia bacterium]|nr:hypothetical protein [Clostridia bacterium]
MKKDGFAARMRRPSFLARFEMTFDLSGANCVRCFVVFELKCGLPRADCVFCVVDLCLKSTLPRADCVLQ